MPGLGKDPCRPVVAQILYSGLGGHGGVVTSMIHADSNRRWRHALCFAGIEPLLPTYAAMCAAEDVPFAYVRAVAGKPWLSYLPMLRWLWRTKPDAIILHSATHLPGVLPYARLRGVPLVVVEHQANELKTRHEWLFSKLSMRLADGIVTLTPQYRDQLAKRLGKRFDREKVTIIPNGIDVAAFGPAALANDTCTSVRVGMAARFSAIKRFDIMIDAIRLLQRTASQKWQLSLAGSGEHWDQVRAYAAASGIEDIRFEGMLTGAALADWYRSLDIYAHASDGESFGLSVLQAMASGVPIVASDVEGIASLLAGNPPRGALVDTPTAQEFATTLAAMARHPEQAKAMANAARAEAERLYDQSAMFARYADLIARLSARR